MEFFILHALNKLPSHLTWRIFTPDLICMFP
uniref:Uncharacterized protein n=1 Tax=Arundo donax TaxID=35708 RepID=A0A0A9ALN4_ARUDO